MNLKQKIEELARTTHDGDYSGAIEDITKGLSLACELLESEDETFCFVNESLKESEHYPDPKQWAEWLRDKIKEMEKV